MDNIKELITAPGQVIVEKLTLYSTNGFSFDLRPIMVDFSVKESLKDVFVSGNVSITESLNIPRFAPIVGEEYVHAVFYTPSMKKVDYVFSVSGISRRIVSNKNSTYVINLVSTGLVLSNLKQISKSFDNMSYSDMAKVLYVDIFQTDRNSFIYKDSRYKKKYVANYDYPANILTDLAYRTIDPENNANYVFYERLDNTYNFLPLVDEFPVKFEYTNFSSNISGIHNLIEYSRIRNLEVNPSLNVLKNLNTGVYGSESIEIDTVYKTMFHSSESYHGMFNKSPSLNQYPLLPQSQTIGRSKGAVQVFPKASYNHDRILNNENYREVLVHRDFQLNGIDSHSISIEVYGVSDRHVGDKVKILIQSPQATDIDTEKYDPHMSGIYLVADITHMISSNQYITVMLLVKDSNWVPLKESN